MKKARTITVIFAFAMCSAAMSFTSPQSQAKTGAKSLANASDQAAAAAGNSTSNIKSGTKISAQLQSALDARTAKPGQQIVARVTKNVKQHGRTVIHKGDKLIGRVTSVQPSASGNAGSQIAVAFDQLSSGGTTSQLNAVVTSVFSAGGQAGIQDEPMDMPGGPVSAPMAAPVGRGGGGGLLGGATSSVGSGVGSSLGATTGAVGSTAGGLGSTVGGAANTSLAGGAAAGLATPTRSIHIGSGASADSSAGTNSVFSTRHGNLRMDSGTQMQLRASGSAQASASPHKQ